MGEGGDETPSRMGRPPRISRAMIAEATSYVGLDSLTLRAVAEHLGVSVAALYHHVAGKEDLVRVAAEYAAGRIPLPQDTDQHWAAWLLEWARYNRDAFVAEPGLLSRFVDGAISQEAIAGGLDRALDGLVRRGFDHPDAYRAYGLVTACALGVAIGTIRSQRDGAATEPDFEAMIPVVILGIALERGERLQTVRKALRSEP